MTSGEILAHGGSDGTIPLGGIGPVLLGIVLLAYFVLLLAGDREEATAPRDEGPSPARLMFEGRYEWRGLMMRADVETSFDPVDEEAMRERADAAEGRAP